MTKARPVKYVARHAGQIVGTRKSPRPYAFAVVVQADEEAARRRAYDYVATDADRSNFEWLGLKAAQAPGVPVRPAGWRFETKFDAEEIAEAQNLTAYGFEGYVAHLRERAIANFEQRRAKGAFLPGVYGWSMSAPNAQKMAASAMPWPQCRGVLR